MTPRIPPSPRRSTTPHHRPRRPRQPPPPSRRSRRPPPPPLARRCRTPAPRHPNILPIAGHAGGRCDSGGNHPRGGREEARPCGRLRRQWGNHPRRGREEGSEAVVVWRNGCAA
ncbi:hypothetical protein ABZP36_007591 [Zizania latifolia]